MGEEPPISLYMSFATGVRFFEIILAKGYLKNNGKFNIAESLKRLNKKGSTLSKLSGPPKLNNITAFFI
jgi:hypothetical protein